jgi:peptide deformylase
MKVRIRYLGDPILRKKAVEVKSFDNKLQELIELMYEYMYKYDGVGLAAPQVGLNERFFVIDDGQTKRTVINPEILESLGEDVEYEEGCLSIPKVYAAVMRPEGIKVKYQDVFGNTVEEELHEYTARIFQHEYDHLEGVLFIDKLTVVQRAKIKSELSQIIKETKKSLKKLTEE